VHIKQLQTQVDGLQLRIEHCLHICYLYFIFVWIGTMEEVLFPMLKDIVE
jgi:hypothetical protein